MRSVPIAKLGLALLLAGLVVGALSPQSPSAFMAPHFNTPISISKIEALQLERFVVRVPEEFPTIQAAIDAVAEGGTVLIGPGVYKENVQITKSLRLIGVSQEQVRIQAVDEQKPVLHITAKAPMQIYLQGLTISREQTPEIREPFTFIPPGAGVFIIGPVQTIMRQLTISKQVGAVVIFSLAEYNEELLRFQPQAVLEEVQLVHNREAVVAASAHITILHSNISENEIGFMGDSLYLTHSVVRKSRFWGIDLRVPSAAYGPQYMGALDDNEISENGVGVILGAMDEEAAGSWLWMNGNNIVRNQEYGIMILKKECLTSLPHPELALGRESAFIRILGGDNELGENLKGDLCPPDYPWPPGFRK